MGFVDTRWTIMKMISLQLLSKINGSTCGAQLDGFLHHARLIWDVMGLALWGSGACVNYNIIVTVSLSLTLAINLKPLAPPVDLQSTKLDLIKTRRTGPDRPLVAAALLAGQAKGLFEV